MQMLDLPAGSEGLTWIVKRDPARLQLIPGVHPASLAAAAVRDQQALAYLKFTAQAQAAYPGVFAQNDMDKAVLQASAASSSGSCICDDDLKTNSAFTAEVFRAREKHTLMLIHEAASSGELAALMWLRAICPRTWLHEDQSLLAAAAREGQLNVLKYLRSGPDPQEWDDEILTAAMPHLECLKWLLSADASGGPCPCDAYTLSDIAWHHDLPALQWFWTNGQLGSECFNKGVLRKAVKKGDLSMVQWLRAQDPPAPWDEGACATAARRGDIGMLGWLRGQNPPCPWDVLVTQGAASNDIKTLQWLRAQDPPCPWGTSTCAAAAMRGKLDALIWLRGQDPPCPWNQSCAKYAARRPDVTIMRWLLDNQGLSQSSVQSECIQTAACRENLAMLEELYKHGIPLTGELYILAAQRNHGHIVRFLDSCNIALPASTVRVETSTWPACHIRLPYLMFLSDIGPNLLLSHDQQQVTEARRACCLFHGLVRWCKRAVSDPSSNAHLAFDSAAEDRSGQLLLAQLSQLPPELVGKIAVAAELQHDFFELPA